MPLLLRTLVIGSLIFTAYSFQLSSPFKTGDDRNSIVANILVKDIGRWTEVFKQGYFQDTSYYRPLVNLSYMIEHRNFGLDPFYYNLDNILIHIASAVLVMALVTAVTTNIEIGFWTGLLFAVHPVQWEAVANVSGRAILLAGLFDLTAFLAFILFIAKRNKVWLCLSTLTFAMALLCKESAGVLPGVLALYLLLMPSQTGKKKAWRALLCFLAVIIVYLALRQGYGVTTTHAWRNATEYALGFVTFLRSVITDLRIFLIPTDLHFDRSLRLFNGILEIGALLTILFWSTMLVILGSMRKWIPPMGWFLMGWFTLELFPVSQVVTTIGVQPGTISTAEHFLYLASVPFFMGCVILVGKLSNLNAQKKWLSPVLFKSVCGAFLGFLFVTTISQAIYARNELSMLSRSIELQPGNARLQYAIGRINATRGDYQRAEMNFRQAAQADPNDSRYRIGLAQSLCDQGLWGPCLSQYVLIEDAGKDKEIYDKNLSRAVRTVQAEIAKGDSLDDQSWFALGVFYAKQGRTDEAFGAFQKAIELNPKNAGAQFNLDAIQSLKRKGLGGQ